MKSDRSSAPVRSGWERLVSTVGLVVAACLTLSACSILGPTEEDEFHCVPGGEPKPNCRSPMAIYKSTHGEPPLVETDAPVSWADLMKSTSGELVKSEQKSLPNEVNDGPASARAEKNPVATPSVTLGLTAQSLGLATPEVLGRPVREQAKVMRIWIAPYVDQNDDLHYPSYLYTEIQPRRWALGAGQMQQGATTVGGQPTRVIPHKSTGTGSGLSGVNRPAAPGAASFPQPASK